VELLRVVAARPVAVVVQVYLLVLLVQALGPFVTVASELLSVVSVGLPVVADRPK
jgi:hypothetical protein